MYFSCLEKRVTSKNAEANSTPLLRTGPSSHQAPRPPHSQAHCHLRLPGAIPKFYLPLSVLWAPSETAGKLIQTRGFKPCPRLISDLIARIFVTSCLYQDLRDAHCCEPERSLAKDRQSQGPAFCLQRRGDSNPHMEGSVFLRGRSKPNGAFRGLLAFSTPVCPHPSGSWAALGPVPSPLRAITY